ncbi:MAG: hypothetical protein AAFV38_04495, partial [Pseudomonadota bacterium]
TDASFVAAVVFEPRGFAGALRRAVVSALTSAAFVAGAVLVAAAVLGVAADFVVAVFAVAAGFSGAAVFVTDASFVAAVVFEPRGFAGALRRAVVLATGFFAGASVAASSGLASAIRVTLAAAGLVFRVGVFVRTVS